MGTISYFLCLLFCLSLRKQLAFCTILPFYFGWMLVFSSSPIAPILPLKLRFLTPVLPFSAMCLIALKGFVYAIVVDVYAFCLAFSGISPCVLHYFALHLAPKRTAFSTKTHCVLRHIARHLAAYCTIFCCKSPKNRCKWRFLEINIHFIVFTN